MFQVNDDTTRALRDILFDRCFDTVHAPVRAAVEELKDSAESGLSPTERGRRSYEQLRQVLARLGSSRRVAEDLPTLFALFEWSAVGAPDLFPVLSGHLNLTVGALLRLGTNTPDQRAALADLENAQHVGVFLLTELGYGSNVAELKTEAVWEPASRTFLLHTPRGEAVKFMPNVAAEGIPKITVVAARLKVAGRDEGVFPFLVRLRDEQGTTPGIQVFPMPDKGFTAMDNAMIRFDRVRVPHGAWLTGRIAAIGEDGVFTSVVGRRGDRFHRTIEQLQAGRTALAAGTVAAARAGLWLTVRYGQQRRTANGRTMLDRDNVAQPLASGTASILAAGALANQVKRQFVDSRSTAPELALLAMLAKPLLSGTALSVLQECRERCGAQGVFRANRLTDYLGITQAVITAEGENQVLRVSAGRALMTRPQASTVLAPPPASDRPETLLYLREQALLRRPWPGSPGLRAMALADTAAVRLAAAALGEQAARRPGRAGDILRIHSELYAWERVAENAAWYAAEGVLPAERAADMHARTAELRQAAASVLPQVTESFGFRPGIPGSLFSEDYVHAWLTEAGWSPFDDTRVAGNATQEA
ncbi:acyl-CoA dehydrogenase family protein [Streptomyces longwoodensis]|uniref:acyl-CoA dehydrogenase family protein n=1 Tax=Streptomyces longwoodensis TaxID=68231 RepID=UPI0033C90C7A